jgi:D-3-phosphoglycerate dehydrogenase
MKVFISTTTFAEYSKEPLELLRKKGIDFKMNPHGRKLSEAEIGDILEGQGYEGLIAGTEPLTRKVLEKAGSLKVISRVGVGMDNVDLKTAGELGIKVRNTPSVLVDSVAELTIGMIMCCLRRIVSADRNVRNKGWKKEMGALFRGKTLGIIGLGKIGKRVAQLAKAFGAKVVFCDIKKIKTSRYRQVSMERLLAESDIISVNSSSKDVLISEKEISRMKNGAMITNTSRGSAVDEESLYRALKTGKISMAALDVFSDEPYHGKLTELDNVVMTPHMGSYAREARVRMELEAVENLIGEL